MTYSESESDFNFAINSASVFDSASESGSESKSDFSSVFMNLGICIIYTLYLHSSKLTCKWFFFLSILMTESIAMQAMQV